MSRKKCFHPALDNGGFAEGKRGGNDSFEAEGTLDSREILGPEIAGLFG